jgi:hypothetical protein
MFEPEVLGLSSSQYQQIAISFVAPTLGFLFLFLLGLPLKKIPFVDVIEDYTPPTWVLPLFALGSLFALCLFGSITFFANYFTEYPDDRHFLAQFIKKRTLNVPADVGKLEAASITLNDYDGSSNFRFYVNGYRMLGSSSDCLLSYQCKPPNPQSEADLQTTRSQHLKDRSFHHIHSLHSLPHTEAILDHLVQGNNFVDLVSENSNLGDCKIDAVISLSFAKADSAAKTNLYFRIKIEPDMEKEVEPDGGTNVEDKFFSYGRVATGEGNVPDFIDPYGTRWSDGTDRLCERVRVSIDLSQDAKVLNDNDRDRLLFLRHRAALCEVVNYARPYCASPKEP